MHRPTSCMRSLGVQILCRHNFLHNLLFKVLSAIFNRGAWHCAHAQNVRGGIEIKMVEQHELGFLGSSSSSSSTLTTSISSSDGNELTGTSCTDAGPTTSLLSWLKAPTHSNLSHKHSVAANLVNPTRKRLKGPSSTHLSSVTPSQREKEFSSKSIGVSGGK